jgi:hypothetical protein
MSGKSTITDLTKKTYKMYFDCALGDQEKNWSPHISCLTCATTLTEWMKGSRCAVSLVFQWYGVSQTTVLVTHFCFTDIAGHSSRIKHTDKYPDISSTLKPVPHEVGLPAPLALLETTESGASQESEPEDEQHSESTSLNAKTNQLT